MGLSAERIFFYLISGSWEARWRCDSRHRDERRYTDSRHGYQTFSSCRKREVVESGPDLIRSYLKVIMLTSQSPYEHSFGPSELQIAYSVTQSDCCALCNIY